MMKKRINYNSIALLTISCITSSFANESNIKTNRNFEGEIPLKGQYEGPSHTVEIDPAKKQSVSDLMTNHQPRPVLSQKLVEDAKAMAPQEYITAIISLEGSPQVLKNTIDDSELADIRNQTQSLLESHAQNRDTSAPFDADNFFEFNRSMSQNDQQRLQELNIRYEAASNKIRKQRIDVLEKSVDPIQNRVRSELEKLGVIVEHSINTGNFLIVKTPVGVLDDIVKIPGIRYVSENRIFTSQLNIADDATLVTSARPGGGLWDNGYTGGIFDVAVIDTGTDLFHPFLMETGGRKNYWAWSYSGNFQDYCDILPQGIDDLVGHGTHVMGIVASQGSIYDPQILGMAHGVEKTVHLKGAYLTCNERSGSFPEVDTMILVDNALTTPEDLFHNLFTSDFNDDVDGFNYSAGRPSTQNGKEDGTPQSYDQTLLAQFWDAVVDDFPDTIVTISAGNSGSNNQVFSVPANAYNVISVANIDDRNTANRADDTINPSSTRGPTVNGRRKPDLAAPGTNIASANNNWENEPDWRNATGTSMASPAVLGVAINLMEAGVTNEKAVKALLINTAQKNEPGINFENDSDGWSRVYGWGYINAYEAYYHRSDIHEGEVSPNGNNGDYVLYFGKMRDEGSSGTGRDRATLVWNRHVTYNGNQFPVSLSPLNDLDLFLYDENDSSQIDSDQNEDDNVHQVRIESGAPFTDVVVKVNAYSSNFSHGENTEPFALATEEDFNLVEFPENFQAFATRPSTMSPNEEREFIFSIENQSDIASHLNKFDLVLPPGWTKVSGSDPFNAGSIPSGKRSSKVTWKLKAPSTPGSYGIKTKHSHNSYGESWGPHTWTMTVDVVASADSDGDGVADDQDNCTNKTNPDQQDTNSDKIGNACDTDLNNDCKVDFQDAALFKTVFPTNPVGTQLGKDADFNSDSKVDFQDALIFKPTFPGKPGPSAAGCN